MNYTTLIITLIFIIILTFILKLFDNKSGTATCFILPSAIAALSIYLIGGWDLQKPNWCSIDILTWLIIFVFVFLLCLIPYPKSKDSHQFDSHSHFSHSRPHTPPPHSRSIPEHLHPQSNLY